MSKFVESSDLEVFGSMSGSMSLPAGGVYENRKLNGAPGTVNYDYLFVPW